MPQSDLHEPRRRLRTLPRLTLGRKLLLSNLVVILPLIVYFVAGFLWSSSALDQESEITARHVKDQREALQLKAFLLQTDDALFRYLATGDAAWRDGARAAMSGFNQQLASEIGEERGPDAAMLRQIDELYHQQYEPLVTRQMDSGPTDANGAKTEAALRQLLATLEQYVSYHEGAIEASRRAMTASNDRLESMLVSSVVVALVVVGLAAFIMAWLLLRPVRDLEAVVHAYRDGEDAIRPRVLPDDEIGDLGRAFVDALDRIDSQQELLRSLSVTDPLTGLFNRRRLDEALGRLDSADAPLAIALLDIDNFKGYNDVCGHLAGDDVLRTVADIVRRHVRPGDIAARYGGEEICLILFEAGPSDGRGALDVLDRIRRTIERYPFPESEGHRFGSVTVSMGATAWRAGEPPLEALRRADVALYRAKQGGKNRVEWASGKDAA